jgi:hypothetical protein
MTTPRAEAGRGHNEATEKATSTVTQRCWCPRSLQLRSRDRAGSAGRATGGRVLCNYITTTLERCECCPGCRIRPGEPVHLVQDLDGHLLVVCGDCVGWGTAA